MKQTDGDGDLMDGNRICLGCGMTTTRLCLQCLGRGATETKQIEEILNVDEAPAGFMAIAENGLIREADETSAVLLGCRSAEMIGKPVTLFIKDEDLSLFFIHRNALFATRQEQSFEIKLTHMDGGRVDVRLNCTFVRGFKDNPDRMQIAVHDFSARRRTLEDVRHRLELERIVQTVIFKMIRSPAREIDVAIIRSLKLLVLFAGVERCYLAGLNPERNRLTITHEWCARQQTIPVVQKEIAIGQYPPLAEAIGTKEAKIVLGSESAGLQNRWAAPPLHLEGTRTRGYFPLVADGAVTGLLGFDGRKPQTAWTPAMTHLFQTTGYLLQHGTARRENELAWLKRHKDALRKSLKGRIIRDNPPPEPVMDELPAITETEIDLREAIVLDTLPTGLQSSEESQIKWRYESVHEEVPESEVLTIPLIDDHVLISCPQCLGQDQTDLATMDELGKPVKAVCACGYMFYITPEQRNFYRKTVSLEGVFLRTKESGVVSDSLGYEGKLRIINLSRQGLGFTTLGINNLHVGDEVRVIFTLDNVAQSQIVKELEIKGVRDQYAGGRFLHTDKDDVTLGFYLM